MIWPAKPQHIDRFTDLVKQFGLGGLLWGKITQGGASGAAGKFLSEDRRCNIGRLAERNGSTSSEGILMIGAGREAQEDAMGCLGSLSPSNWISFQRVSSPSHG